MAEPLHAQLDALRRRGADRADPVRFHYLEALARRALSYQGEVRRLLDGKLEKALAAYGECVAQTCGAEAVSAQTDAAAPTPLATLVRDMTQHTPQFVEDNEAGGMGFRHELKAMREHKDAWTALSVEKQLTQAMTQGPENAGPLNSHRLVLRSLEAMRDIAPGYLKRFVSYADALLWLDQAGNTGKAKPKKRTRKK